jgi:hypothetical protein
VKDIVGFIRKREFCAAGRQDVILRA